MPHLSPLRLLSCSLSGESLGESVNSFFNNAKIEEWGESKHKARWEGFLESFPTSLRSVGARGFEPPTTTTPLWCATGLRYAPLLEQEQYSR